METGNTVSLELLFPCAATGAHEHDLRVWKRSTLTRCAIADEYYFIQEGAKMVPKKTFRSDFALVSYRGKARSKEGPTQIRLPSPILNDFAKT